MDDENKYWKGGKIMKEYPKFEKVDKNTIKIIVENSKNIPLSTIINNQKQLLEQKAQIEEALKNVDTILANAKKLGIVPKEKTKDVEKKNG